MAEKTFTEALEHLEKAASEISRQTTSLEDSVKLLEEGLKEAEYCRKLLVSAEQHIETYRDGGQTDAKL